MPPKVGTSSVAGLARNQVSNVSQSSASTSVETPSTTGTLASPQTASAADHKEPSKDKVPRPPNAFIIYRQEWHPKVVKEHPDWRNNDICKFELMFLISHVTNRMQPS